MTTQPDPSADGITWSRLFADGFNFLRSDPIFIDEALANLDAMAQALDPQRPETLGPDPIDAVFRHAHSVKGGAAVLGLLAPLLTASVTSNGVTGGAAVFELLEASELMHQAESLLDQWRQRRFLPDRQGIPLLRDSVELTRARLKGPAPEPSLTLALTTQLRAAVNVQLAMAPELLLLWCSPELTHVRSSKLTPRSS